MSRWTLARTAVALALGFAAVAEADEPIGLGAKKSGEAQVQEVEAQDLVTSAMKTKTRVQEAPAIITVVTEPRFDMQGYRSVYDAIGSVPGFNSYQLWYGWGSTHFPIARGMLSGPLILKDGLDQLDSAMGAMNLRPEAFPLQTVKRIEVTSGPGGVMWGSNAMMGVVNIVSKTADDLQGVEAFAGGGGGPGRPGAVKTYVMGGVKLFKERLKILAHVSYDTWHEPALDPPIQTIIRSTSPNPQGPALLVGPITPADAKRSHQILFSGNAQAGRFFLNWNIPWGEFFSPTLTPGTTLHESLPEDSINCSDPANRAACAALVDPQHLSRFTRRQDLDRQVMAGYSGRHFQDRLSLTVRGFFTEFYRKYDPWVIVVPNQLLIGGITAIHDFTSYRGGGSFDGEYSPLSRLRLLFGGEVFYDYLPQHKQHFYTDTSRLPFLCPPDEGDLRCPMEINAQSDRLTAGAFINGQLRLPANLAIDGGGRVQVYAGKRSLSPVGLFSGGAVWSFLPNWNLKLNYAEGFRPPALTRTDSSVVGMKFSGNADLRTEKSRAIQGELNARLLREIHAIKQLSFRADYAYTWVRDFIDVNEAVYSNVGDIGIHSVEALAHLDLSGGHWFSVGYTFLDIAMADRGNMRTMPNQWLTLQAAVNLWRARLFVASNLSIFGSAEDPNRYAAQPAGAILIGDVDGSGQPKGTPAFNAEASDMTFDRIPPAAIWNAGLRFLIPKQRLQFAFDVYNLLNAKAFYPGEGFLDYSVVMEMIPNPRAGISFFFSAQFNY